jgi:hypothetical protein
MNRPGGLWRAASLAVVIAFSLGAASCGDEAGGGDDQGGGSARAEVESTIRDMWKRFAAAAEDPAAAESYCAQMTPAYRKVQVASSFGAAKTCPEAVAAASKVWHRRGYDDLPVEVLSISVKGREAVVKTTGGIVGHDTYRLRLVRDRSGWKLPADALEPLSG